MQRWFLATRLFRRGAERLTIWPLRCTRSRGEVRHAGERMVMAMAVAGMLLGCETSGPTDCNGQPSSDEVCIMGGSFLMGHAAISDRPGDSPFAPVHKVTLSPFFIDIDPISNVQYKACFDAGACPDEPPCPDPCLVPFQAAYSIHDPALADYPMATATVEGAEAYCLFAGKRLPTEAEWERAARVRRASTTPGATRRPIARRCTAICRRSTRTFLIPRKLSRRPGDRRRIPGGRAGDVDDGPPHHGGRAPALLDRAGHQPTRSRPAAASSARKPSFLRQRPRNLQRCLVSVAGLGTHDLLRGRVSLRSVRDRIIAG
jgi:hypothetical protein